METVTINQLLNQIKTYDEEAIPLIKKAYDFASEIHSTQKRKSGELYITHPLRVASILANANLDRDTICAALLHDVIEDGIKITKEQIELEFNSIIATIVDGVTKMDKNLFSTKEAQNNANTRKLIMGIKIDLRIILVKLADRLDNMRTIKHLPISKQIENALETLEIHVPLANRIGFHQVAKELADLSFQCLNYDLYQMIDEKRQQIMDKNPTILEDMSHIIHTSLNHEGIENEVSYRIKNVYSIYEKITGYKLKPSDIIELSQEDLLLSKITEQQIHDLRSLKILVSELEECYDSQEILEQEFSIVTGKQKDCIKHPKTNGYQSLHTTIYAQDGMPVQTKIRTLEMEQFSLLGLVALWSKNIKNAPFIAMQSLQMKFPFFQSLIELDNVLIDDKEFVETTKLEVFSNMVFPITSNGEVIELPYGATPVDFAYKTEPTVGYTSMIAKVNGKLVPLSYKLQSKDTVEIIPTTFQDTLDINLSAYALTACAKRKIQKRETRN